ncbi:MAG: prephenate dehydratase [Clostridia bacterium]|nr:prephenate dehydratase [Clostridia bacterium]
MSISGSNFSMSGLPDIPEDFGLDDVRGEIDEIDKQLLELFVRRMHVAGKVAAIKKRTGAPIIQPEREQAILKRVEAEGGEFGGGARTLMATLIDISCTYQQMLLYGDDGKLRKKFLTAGKIIKGSKIACQGTSGAYSHLAAKQFFGEDAEPVFFPGFRDVFDAVTEEYADFGVLPLENTTAGAVNDVYDLLTLHGFYIVGETDVAINHCLLAPKGASPDGIKEVYAHPQALAQCARYIQTHGFNTNEYSNNAVAAKNVARWNDPTKAAIASGVAGKQFGLDILDEGIQDIDGNQTRFIIISKHMVIRDGADKISLTFTLPHRTGSLYRVLSRFAANGMNISKIESRPLRGQNFQYRFYLDFNGNVHDERVCALICSLSTEMSYFKFLGNY